MHRRDLPGWAAEAQRCDPQPHPESLAEGDAMRGTGRCSASVSMIRRHLAHKAGPSFGGVVPISATEGVITHHLRFDLTTSVRAPAAQAQQARRIGSDIGTRDADRHHQFVEARQTSAPDRGSTP